MANQSVCGRCGTALTASAVEGLCPMCLFKDGLNQVAATREAAPPVPMETSGARIGPYKLLQRLGEGGMGSVWLAEQLEPIRRNVALKLIKPGMDSSHVLARFEAERQALALMDHANIARVFDAGTTAAGRPYFVMEAVKGLPFTKYCDEHRLSIRERVELFIPVCQAIQHAHQKGIIHRDIKPSNVLVTQADGRPVPKVIDFGVAKALGNPLTERTLFTGFGVLVGTLEYMSPEQAEFNQLDIDTRSDIYSLGVLLYQVLAGSTPLCRDILQQNALDEVLRRIREQDPPRPSTRLSESKEQLATISAQRRLDPVRLTKLIRGDLDWIVMKALEKQRDRRYSTAQSLALDIQRHLRDEPVSARPPTPGYRLRKLARKHRTGVAMAAALAFLLIAGATVSTGFGLWANRQRSRAEKAESDARKNAQDARAVLDFLRDKILAAARPEGKEGGLGVNVSVRRAVETAESQITLLFSNRPVVEAEIRNALGSTFLNLGEYGKAVEQLERTLALITALEGPRSPNTLAAMSDLADAYRHAGRHAEAVAVADKTLTLNQNELGPEHANTLMAMNNLAENYRAAGRWQDAILLLRQTLEIRERVLGVNHSNTINSRQNLAHAYLDAKRYGDALPLLQLTVQARTSMLGPEHYETLQSINSLAVTYERLGDWKQALPLLEKVVEIQRAKLGPSHPTTLGSIGNLGIAYLDAKRFTEAISLFEQALEASRTKLGPDHPDTVNQMNNVALAYRDVGRVAEAIDLLTEVVRLAKTRLGPHDWRTLDTVHSLASTYVMAGRLPEAIGLFEETLAARRLTMGVEHRDTRGAILSLANAYRDVRRFADAEPLYRELLQYRRTSKSKDALKLSEALADLGECLSPQGKYALAEPLLREALAIHEQNKWDAWPVFYIQSCLGEALLGQKNFKDAEPLLLKGYEGLKKREDTIPKSHLARLPKTAKHLEEVSQALGKPEQAASWHQKASQSDASVKR